MIYLTFNDSPSGVYRSQVIGTCRFLRDELGVPASLLAFVSLRLYRGARSSLKRELPSATVLPMFPSVRNWARNGTLLRWALFREQHCHVIARGVFAANLALQLRDSGIVEKVCYDGRGAVAAEHGEYGGAGWIDSAPAIWRLERTAVLESDFRLSVSQALVRYWEDEYGFHRSAPHAVVPCVLSHGHEGLIPDWEAVRSVQRERLGWAPSDVALIYAGSTAGWQSLASLGRTLARWLRERRDLKVLFLARDEEWIRGLANEFPDRVARRFVDPEQVPALLAAADYGLLIREDSQTNRVAAPTKFAEYLSAGLDVLISPNLGDYSNVVRRWGVGEVLEIEDRVPDFQLRTEGHRARSRALATRCYTRGAYRSEYERLVQFLGGVSERGGVGAGRKRVASDG